DPPPWMAKRPAGIRAFMETFKSYDLDREALRRFDRPVYFALGGLSNPDQYAEIATRLGTVFADFELEVFEARHHFDPPHRIEPERLAVSLRALWRRAEEAVPSGRVFGTEDLMRESPAPPEALVTLANWQDPPFNRWGFQHVRDLIPTARIGRGDAPVVEFERAPRDLDAIRVPGPNGADLSLSEALAESYTDGFLILHDGRIVDERYFTGMTPATTHLLMSVSKSVTGALAGALVGRGLLDPASPITAYVPEPAGPSFDGATVRHLLDMR